MELIGALALLLVTLCALFLCISIFSFFLSFPGWLVGRIAVLGSPQLKSMRHSRFYITAWLTLGVAPIALCAAGGRFSGAGQFLPNSASIVLGALGLIMLNVNAFFLGYKMALSAKAKREISKALSEPTDLSPTVVPTPDVLDENHPAVTPALTPTIPLPAVDADRPLDEDAPTQEISVRDTVPPNDECPTARPHED